MKLIDRSTEGLRPLVGDITNQVVVIDWRMLNRRYQLPRFQLIKARGGFGCQEGSLGSRIFGTSIADGEDFDTRRGELLGIASAQLIEQALADNTSVSSIDLSLREYLLVARDGAIARGATVEEARQRLQRKTKARVTGAYEVHPESVMTDLGFISYPSGAPPLEIKIKKGNVWTTSH